MLPVSYARIHGRQVVQRHKHTKAKYGALVLLAPHSWLEYMPCCRIDQHFCLCKARHARLHMVLLLMITVHISFDIAILRLSICTYIITIVKCVAVCLWYSIWLVGQPVWFDDSFTS